MMAEDKNSEIAMVMDQLIHLKQQLEEITVNYSHLIKKVEQIEKSLEQRNKEPSDVQVISSFDKKGEVSAYAEENRSFIQSILKRKK